jgi:hypothetical protein
MKKMYKIASTAVLGLLMVSILSSTAMAAALDYLPTEEDLVGYNLVQTFDATVTNPFASTGTITTGAQLWYKNDTINNLQAVIGVVVIQADSNPLLDDISPLLKPTVQTLYPGVNTWWDLFVALMCATAPLVFEDVSDVITTTESSVSITIGTTFYAVVSVDTNYIVMTFAFEVDTLWLESEIATIQSSLISLLTTIQGQLGTFIGYLELYSSGLEAAVPLPEASTVTYTSNDDVNSFTNEMGTFYQSTVPGYSPLIVLGLVGASVLYFVKKKRVVVQ